MPILQLEDGTFIYECDVCGEEFDQELGTSCPKCGRIFCQKCSAEHGVRKVKVGGDDLPEYKQYDYMCRFCYEEWKKKNPKQVQLTAFLGKNDKPICEGNP